MDYIRQHFDTLNIKITPETCLRLFKTVTHWETKGTHPLTLNGQLLGVYPMTFTETDRAALFHMVEVEEIEVKTVIKNCAQSHRPPPIQLSHKVTSDPFNLLSVYLVYKGYQDLYKSHQKECEKWMYNVIKYWHYKLFSSLVGHYFPHGTNEEVFMEVVANLNRRFDLITKGSWKAIIDERCEIESSLDPRKNIHWKTFETFSPDDKVLYIISDTQTRLRDKVGLIRDMYYQFHGEGKRMGLSSATGTDMEGEKVLVEKNTTLDSAITAVCVQLLSVNSFVEQRLIDNVLRQFPDVSHQLMRHALESLCNKAAIQMRERKIDDVIKHKDGRIEYVGMRAIVKAIVQTSFNYCLKNKIDIRSKYNVFTTMLARYRASHMKDPYVIAIKETMLDFVIKLNRTNRPATQASLRLALIMYVLLKALLEI